MCPNFFWQNVLKGKNIPAIHFIGKPRAKPFIFPLISNTLKSQAKRVIHMAGRSFILGSLSTPGWDQSLIHWAGSSRMMRICPENGSTPMVKSIYQCIGSIENWQEPRTHHEISWFFSWFDAIRFSVTLWWTNSLQLKMTQSKSWTFPIEKWWIFPLLCKRSPDMGH